MRIGNFLHDLLMFLARMPSMNHMKTFLSVLRLHASDHCIDCSKAELAAQTLSIARDLTDPQYILPFIWLMHTVFQTF